ncbi:alpha/beta-hydrolase [Exidia glandulosa HHB12029]|uniref:Alpha/beta-hydrolase n=1 Tax=Exidia glandulosa HHB12029 TaxID=1314781 RepID=A0A165ELI3_EXIGL|nr:alpha/beta-hydrolase [Exidia glandulosa HHB12029]
MTTLHKLRTIRTSEDGSYIAEVNADIPLSDGGVLRCNVYRPLDAPATDDTASTGARYPVLVTMSPYGKDVPYANFHPMSYAGMHPNGKGEDAVWETPLPRYWTKAGYVVVRIDERGFGQSPGFAKIMSDQVWQDFATAIEWAAEQSWSTGKVGLLGISYYAITQWGAASLRPKGLAAIVPWEGACDPYRDAARHGGILSSAFIDWWWNRQVATMLYGLPGRAARKWGPDTLEGDLTPEQLAQNHLDWPRACREFPYADVPLFKDSAINVENIQVPLLSVANWGGTGLHPRGNVQGYMRAASTHKWLFFITGRHDLPFYRDECIALQRSFLDAFCKGEDSRGWLKGPNAEGGVPAVRLVVRKPGGIKVDDEPADRGLLVRSESAWPIPGTTYTPFFLSADKGLSSSAPSGANATFEYVGLNGDAIQFSTAAFQSQTEVTGHPVAHLFMSQSGTKDIDVFVTLRQYAADGSEVFYTGTTGKPITAGKGWLRASTRAIDASHPLHKPYVPYRHYARKDVSFPKQDEVVEMVVEIWPVHFVIEQGGKLVLEISPKDTAGTDAFVSDDAKERSEEAFGGVQNRIHIADKYQSRLVLPIVPAAGAGAEPQW